MHQLIAFLYVIPLCPAVGSLSNLLDLRYTMSDLKRFGSIRTRSGVYGSLNSYFYIRMVFIVFRLKARTLSRKQIGQLALHKYCCSLIGYVQWLYRSSLMITGQFQFCHYVMRKKFLYFHTQHCSAFHYQTVNYSRHSVSTEPVRMQQDIPTYS